MRATGLGFKSPKDRSGEIQYPMRKPDGTVLDMNYKTTNERRRELLFLHKIGTERAWNM